MITWINNNLLLARLIWFLCAIIGTIILRRIRSEFYDNKSLFERFIIYFYYMIMGPLSLIVAIVCLIADSLNKQKSEK